MGSVTGLGTRACGFVPYGAADAAFTARLADLLADHDEALLAAYLDDEAALPYRRLRRGLARPDRRGPWSTRCSSARPSPAPGSTP